MGVGAVAVLAATAVDAAPVLAAPTGVNSIGLAAVLAGGGPGRMSRAPLILPGPETDARNGPPALASGFNPAAPARSPTAVDYSLARGGPHGSLGYICLDGMAPIAPREAAVTAGTDGGRLIGGSFLIPIP